MFFNKKKTVNDPTSSGSHARMPDIKPGDRIMKHYEVLSELGQGAMSVGYQCLDHKKKMEVALTLLPVSACDTREMEELKGIFQTVSKLQHHNIAACHALERDPDKNCYLVTEFVKGDDLHHWIRRKHEDDSMTWTECLSVIRQIAAALDEAHTQKVIHRNITPANIMITENGTVKVMDFGLSAVMSQKGAATAGTSPYMAPEQWLELPADARTDQYALAAMVYEMLSGTPPFESAEPAVLKQMVLNTAPDEIEGLPDHIQNAIMRAMSRNPGDRFENCIAFFVALVDDMPVSQNSQKQLLSHARPFLKDKDYETVFTCCERTLCQDPVNGGAYLVQLLAELQLQTPEDLVSVENIANNRTFKLALRFADPELAEVLNGVLEEQKRIREEARLAEEKRRAEEARLAEEKRRAEEEKPEKENKSSLDLLIQQDGNTDNDARAREKGKDGGQQCPETGHKFITRLVRFFSIRAGITRKTLFLQCLLAFLSTVLIWTTGMCFVWFSADESVLRNYFYLYHFGLDRYFSLDHPMSRILAVFDEPLFCSIFFLLIFIPVLRALRAINLKWIWYLPLLLFHPAAVVLQFSMRICGDFSDLEEVSSNILYGLSGLVGLIFLILLFRMLFQSSSPLCLSRGRKKLILVLSCTLVAAIIAPYHDLHPTMLLAWLIQTIRAVYCLLLMVVLFRKDAWRHVLPVNTPKRMRFALIGAAILLVVLPYPRFYVQSQCVWEGISSQLDIPWGVTHIPSGAFAGCSNFTNITIPSSVTSIGNYTFFNCSRLKNITIPDSVTSIGESAFSDCSRLTRVTIGNSVTSIGENAFSDCSRLTRVTIGNSVTSIGDSAFAGCSDLTSITIPDSVTSIGNYTFSGCDSLESVTIPDSVTSIGNYTFFDCSRLTNITLPSSVTSIGRGAFSDCSRLTSVTIPGSVTSIGNGAFEDCSSLTSVTIPRHFTDADVKKWFKRRWSDENTMPRDCEIQRK